MIFGDYDSMDSNDLKKKIEELEAKLEETQARLSFVMTAIDNLPNPIFIKDEELRFFHFNKAYSEFFGMTPEEYFGKTVLDLDYIPMEDRIRYNDEDSRLIQTGAIKNYDVDFLCADGKLHPSFYWSRGVHDEKTGKRGIIGEIVDISTERNLQTDLSRTLDDLQSANSKLERAMEIDAGTGIFNRFLLNKIIGEIAHRRTQEVRMTCALLADLDHFKRVNDSFGHLKGDEVLMQFANIIKTECRADDMPIRYGGDEFLLVLSKASEEIGYAVAERIRSRCESEIILPDGSPQTVSIGICRVGDSQNLESVIHKLDNALYEAKQEGRNRVVGA